MFALKQYLQIDITVIRIDVKVPTLQGYARMLNTCRNGELKKYLTAWLCCVADSPVVDYFFCRHCQNYLSMDEIETNYVPGWTEAALDGWGSMNRLHKAYLGLSPDQKMVIYLKIVKGFSNHEVAEALSKPIGAVKEIQRRGLRNLLHLLSSRHEHAAF